ncbi:MATE family efflux transporter [bacterium]|nr:MATE family efflux transporter [bacterium]
MNQEGKAILTDGPVGKILFSLTLPMIFGTVGMVIFNLVDTFYVGQLGTKQLAALSFTFPVVLVINSLALGLGIGASVMISRAIGEGNQHKVQRLTTDSLILALIIVAIFVAIGQLTINPVFRALGAEGEILEMVRRYMKVWYWGMLFVLVPMVGNNAIRACGDTRTPAMIMIVAAITNAILDPLFIFGIGPFPRLELEGAAITTVFSRAIIMLVSLYVLIYRYKMVTFSKPRFQEILDSWKGILYIGIPTAGTRISIPLAMGIVTSLIARYGPEAVAAFGVATRIEFFSLTISRSLSTVIGPFVGQNWGAREYSRILKGVRKSVQFSLIWGLVLFAILTLLAPQISAIFNKNENVISLISLYLSTVPLGFGLYGIVLISVSTLNVLHKPLQAAGLSILQMFALYIPLAYLGAHYMGLTGIFGGITIAYLISGTIAYIILTNYINKMAYSLN